MSKKKPTIEKQLSSLDAWKVNVEELSASGMEDFEDNLFQFLADSDALVQIDRFKSISLRCPNRLTRADTFRLGRKELLEETGLKENDFRLKETMTKFRAELQRQLHNEHELRGKVDKNTFKECVGDNLVVISKALKNDLVIPEWKTFTDKIDELYHHCKPNFDGMPAQYIPQLAKVGKHHCGVSVCSTDGQRYNIGETVTPFCLHSVVKPLNYAFTLNDLSSETVHKFVGHEPSGQSFNELTLDYQQKPHNPMINAGAIVVASLLKKGWLIAARFEYQQKDDEQDLRFVRKAMDQLRLLAGHEHVAFNNSVYLSERATADRNFALGYYMREYKCFPPEADLVETLEFYFQLCSIEVTAESGAVMAATLANGGICPTTGEKVLSTEAVQHTLSLMHSCGMYDYSGQFAFKVGLPAKSGAAGGIMLVIPNVMGIFTWSPPLDNWKNSSRGVQFCEELVAKFSLHNYDNLRHTSKKYDPRSRVTESKARDVVNLLFSAYNGDVTAMRRYGLTGMDMSIADYDGRTALHLAAAEGHEHIVKFLLEKCHVPPCPKDRWGFMPYDDAVKFNHNKVAAILKEAQAGVK